MSSSSVTLRQCAAECMGTFLLVFAISASLPLDYAVPTAIVAALTLMVLVYLLGPVSGAHFNPAISVGLYSLRKISFRQTILYVLSQLLGAFLASLLLHRLIESRALAFNNTIESVIGELMGAFVLAFGVTIVVKSRVDAAATGLVIGLSLFLGIAVASVGSLGVLNPAVSLGLGLFNPQQAPIFFMTVLVYAIMPIIGGFLGANAADWIAEKN